MYVFGRENHQRKNFLDARIVDLNFQCLPHLRLPQIIYTTTSDIHGTRLFTICAKWRIRDTGQLEDLEIELILWKNSTGGIFKVLWCWYCWEFSNFRVPNSFLLWCWDRLYFECWLTIDSSKLEASPFLRTKLTFGLYPPKVWKCHPGIGDSFWKPSFLGSVLNLGRVSPTKNLIPSHHEKFPAQIRAIFWTFFLHRISPSKNSSPQIGPKDRFRRDRRKEP